MKRVKEGKVEGKKEEYEQDASDEENVHRK